MPLFLLGLAFIVLYVFYPICQYTFFMETYKGKKHFSSVIITAGVMKGVRLGMGWMRMIWERCIVG